MYTEINLFKSFKEEKDVPMLPGMFPPRVPYLAVVEKRPWNTLFLRLKQREALLKCLLEREIIKRVS